MTGHPRTYPYTHYSAFWWRRYFHFIHLVRGLTDELHIVVRSIHVIFVKGLGLRWYVYWIGEGYVSVFNSLSIRPPGVPTSLQCEYACITVRHSPQSLNTGPHLIFVRHPLVPVLTAHYGAMGLTARRIFLTPFFSTHASFPISDHIWRCGGPPTNSGAWVQSAWSHQRCRYLAKGGHMYLLKRRHKSDTCVIVFPVFSEVKYFQRNAFGVYWLYSERGFTYWQNKLAYRSCFGMCNTKWSLDFI